MIGPATLNIELYCASSVNGLCTFYNISPFILLLLLFHMRKSTFEQVKANVKLLNASIWLQFLTTSLVFFFAMLKTMFMFQFG